MNADAGRGRLFLDPARQHDDLRLLRRAIKKRWEIPEEFRSIIVGRLRDIIESGDDEIALKAIAEARHLESQNQKDEHKLVDVRIHHKITELAEIAGEIGVDIDLIQDAERSRSGSVDGAEVDGAVRDWPANR
jgi:cellobiose-specific phosphotransferase system component IIB